MVDHEDFGLKPKQDCQVGCPVLKRIYELFKHQSDGLWKQVEEDGGRSSPRSMQALRSMAAANSSVCVALAVAFSPEVAAGMIESMMGGPYEEEMEAPMQLYFCVDDTEEGDAIVCISDLPDVIRDHTTDELRKAVDAVLDSSGVEVDRFVMDNAHMVPQGLDLVKLTDHLLFEGCKPLGEKTDG